ncbi:hypothetical protein TWF703_007758 [Orbilia oligospora]|uniref:Uncharacterized protein n=1 Tax=Orbilia oligospora TaxID=2813651 RepID=A0A7C8JWU8_ORBOL|nr:hypothetical protein TWF703_007758 [Orbilia oligospora]
MALNGLLPTSDYAEDQPLYHFILTTHVVHRVLPIGAFISSAIPLASTFILRALVSLGLGGAMTLGRMWGRADIEWKDRSWRLLRNTGQAQLDDFSAAGLVAGAWLGAAGRGPLPLWRGAVGGAGLGTLAGTVAFVVWKSTLGKKNEQ